MSARLLATQVAGITMGVIGTALFFNAVDKATRHNYHRKVAVFDSKIHRIKGDIDFHGVEVETAPIRTTYYQMPYRSIVFDDLSADPILYDDY